MFKSSFIFLLSFFFVNKAKSQLDKNTWLFGGVASASFTERKSPILENEKFTNVVLRPEVGYFIFDKFAAGLRTGYSLNSERIGTAESKIRETTFGVFTRYYLLPKDLQYNILVDAGYNHTIMSVEVFNGPISDRVKTPKNGYSIAAGPVIYFNSSVGLEFLIEYANTKTTDDAIKEKLLQIALGLQVHLSR